MCRSKTRVRRLAPVAMVLLAAGPAAGAGFGIFEQGTKAMGMAGAFVAQADDPSAMFHNVGGLAFLDEREFAAGFTYITTSEADFAGLNPFPGVGVTASQETLRALPPHLYWVEPLNDRWRFGLAVNSPFGLATEWRDKDTFPGRFISERAALRVVDVNPNLGWQLSDRLGVGFGLLLRVTDVELDRRQAIVNPFTLQAADIARVGLSSDVDTGLGWQVGFLHRYNNSFSWGASYRSKVKVDYSGDANLTQISTGNPQLDALVAATLPFGQAIPITTQIEFPDMLLAGVALALSPDWLLELDANWTGWSSFDVLRVDFQGALPELVRVNGWDDARNYRLGLKWSRGGGEWRFGYVLDESPQPEADVSPLLSDSDRDGFTIGYGRQGKRLRTDVALMRLQFDERTTRTSNDGFNGTYSQNGWLLGVTVGW